MTVVFMHGAGEAGAAAWPRQAASAEAGWTFLDRHAEGDDAERDAKRIVELLGRPPGGHVVGHSFGGNAALLAAHKEPALVRSLVLIEPACFDLARGMPAVEEHISAMTPVFKVATDASVSTREFSDRFSAAMGVPPPDLGLAELERRVARLRALRPPWGVGLVTGTDVPVRTLVLTGGWSSLYEETATCLVAAGAQHEVLPGTGHRPHDASGVTVLLQRFWNQAA